MRLKKKEKEWQFLHCVGKALGVHFIGFGTMLALCGPKPGPQALP